MHQLPSPWTDSGRRSKAWNAPTDGRASVGSPGLDLRSSVLKFDTNITEHDVLLVHSETLSLKMVLL